MSVRLDGEFLFLAVLKNQLAMMWVLDGLGRSGESSAIRRRLRATEELIKMLCANQGLTE